MSAWDLCEGIVIRNGNEEPCEKPAVGLMRATGSVRDEFGPDLWPVCTWHLHRYPRQAVRLSEYLVAADYAEARRGERGGH